MFSENFERICQGRGIKPGIACVKAGLKQNRAANWKATGALPKQDELAKLAMVLNCRVWEFFMDNEEVPFSDPIEASEYWAYLDSINPLSGATSYEIGDEEKNFISIYHKCNLLQRTKLMLLVYEFAEENGIEYEEC